MSEQEKLIEVVVLPKQLKTKDGKKKFTTYKTFMHLALKGEKKVEFHQLDLKFREELSDRIKNIKTRGYLVCNANDVKAPFVYDVVEKDGKKVYPVVWIRDFKEYVETPILHDQSSFVTIKELDAKNDEEDEEDEELDEETPF